MCKLRKTIGTLITAGWPIPSTEEVALRVLRAGTISAFQSLDAKDKIQPIAFGETELDPVKSKKGKIKIPLTAPTIVKDPRRSAKKKRPPLLKAGDSNGYIILKYEVESS